ncbi:MAG: EXLDI protein [Ktedonobacterales bacterium]|jgi:EXLDI family protein
MPNKTIYVTEADQPLFERAQQIAGGNLSAAIAEALRRYVTEADAGTNSDAVTVAVTEGGFTVKKRFHGQLIAQHRAETPDESRSVTYRVYRTQKGRYAVWSTNAPNWGRSDWWKHRGARAARWTPEWWQSESRLDVYETLEDLHGNLPDELVSRVVRGANTGSDIEELDI